MESSLTFISAHPEFAEIFCEYRQDSITRQYNPLMPSTIEELRERLSRASSNWDDFQNNSVTSFMWFVKCGDEIVGNVNLNAVNHMMLTAEIGYGVFPHARKKGIATKMVQCFTSEVFLKTSLRKIMAYVHEDNLASRRVMEKSGYLQEGILREHYIVNGKPANEVIYGILRHEVLIR